jgi:O-antigen ligase
MGEEASTRTETSVVPRAAHPGIADTGRPLAAGPRSPFAARKLAAWLEAGLAIAAFVFLPLLVFAPRGAAALAAIAGACAGGLLLTAGRRLLRHGIAVPAALFGALVAWGAISAAWAPEPWHSLGLAARLAGLFAAGLALAAAADRVAAPARLSRFLLAGFVVATTMAAVDFASAGALTQPFSTRVWQAAWLNQAANAFAILLLPCAAALAGRGRRVAALLFAAAAAATVFALVGSAPKVALGAGLLMAALLRLAEVRTGRIARAAAIVSVLLIVTAPLTFAWLERLPLFPELAERVKQSAEHRLLIWSFVGERIDERPLLGWGLDASRAIPGGREPIRNGETWLPLHPHNAPLQLWLELGVPGAVLGALLAAVVWRALGAVVWPRPFAAAAGGSLAAASVAGLGTYGVWQEWWLGTLWFSLFLVLVMARAAAPASKGG